MTTWTRIDELRESTSRVSACLSLLEETAGKLGEADIEALQQRPDLHEYFVGLHQLIQRQGEMNRALRAFVRR